jgi:hypothetical protein
MSKMLLPLNQENTIITHYFIKRQRCWVNERLAMKIYLTKEYDYRRWYTLLGGVIASVFGAVIHFCFVIPSAIRADWLKPFTIWTVSFDYNLMVTDPLSEDEIVCLFETLQRDVVPLHPDLIFSGLKLRVDSTRQS